MLEKWQERTQEWQKGEPAHLQTVTLGGQLRNQQRRDVLAVCKIQRNAFFVSCGTVLASLIAQQFKPEWNHSLKPVARLAAASLPFQLFSLVMSAGPLTEFLEDPANDTGTSGSDSDYPKCW
jgi:hypothetical protein